MTLRTVGSVNPEFYDTAAAVLRDMQENAEPAVRPVVARTAWELHDQPSPYHLGLLSPPPRPDEVLLGLFTSPPPTIALFEQSIRRVASLKGRSLSAQIRDVAIHEMAQHRFGLNHMHEEPVKRGAGNLLPFHP